jgi:hypothetical protein
VWDASSNRVGFSFLRLGPVLGEEGLKEFESGNPSLIRSLLLSYLTLRLRGWLSLHKKLFPAHIRLLWGFLWWPGYIGGLGKYEYWHGDLCEQKITQVRMN